MRVKTTEVNYELCTEYTLNSRLELTNTKKHRYIPEGAHALQEESHIHKSSPAKL